MQSARSFAAVHLKKPNAVRSVGRAANMCDANAHSSSARGGPGSAELRQQSCKGACGRDTPTLQGRELQNSLAAVPAWRLGDEGKSICRSFVAKNFMAAMRAFNAIAEIAEDEGHHPDLHLCNYQDVKIVLSTHATGGLSMYDFIMAAKIDAVPVEYSPKWLKSQQTSEMHD